VHGENLRVQARALRKRGFTHREIAEELEVGLGTAFVWTKGIVLSRKQKFSIEKRRNRHFFTKSERKAVIKRLSPYQFKRIYEDDELLEKIRSFYFKNGRIPLKRELNSLRIFRRRFGSWNNAV